MYDLVTPLVAMSAAFAASTAGAQAQATGPVNPQAQSIRPDHRVLELRQYKLVHGAQKDFIPLFDKEFVETQEALGIRLIGQFHDHDRPDRFTWIRDFPNMADRARMLEGFYFGPVWHKFAAVANPMLDDNDDVLLLRPAREGAGFGPSASRPEVGSKPGHAATYFAVIEYLWKDPNEGFSSFFLDHAAPLLKAARLPVLGVYVPEEQPNNFPRLPIRPDKKVLVWFTTSETPEGFDTALAKLRSTPAWKKQVEAALDDARERPPQVLRLDPTPRSALR